MTNQLSFQPGDETWTKLREKAKASLKFMASFVMGLQDLVPMRDHAHEAMCRIVDGTTGNPELDSAPYVLLLLPRDWGKSALVTKTLPIQLLARDPNTSILIFNEKLETASQFLEGIKYQFDRNEMFRALFPELIPPNKQETQWSGVKITVPRTTGRSEPSIMVSGVGAAVAGNHPDCILVDDMISREAAEAARRGNWEIMGQANRWTHTVEALLSNQSPHKRRIVWIGTHWYHNDSYDHLIEYFGSGAERKDFLMTVQLSNGHRQTLPVARIGDLVVFERSVREEGQWSWPEKYDEERMLRVQAEDPILYASNFLNRPTTDATSTFRHDWLKTYTWLDQRTISYLNPQGVKTALQLEQLDILMLVDPGGFGQRSTEDRARAALWVVGHTPTGEFLLLDCWSDKDTYVAAQAQVVSKAKRYGVRKVGIEVEGQQLVFFDQTKRMLLDANLNIVVEQLKTSGKAKDDRILQLEPFFQRGLIYLGTGAVFTEFRTQYSQFPRTARRDLLDALAYLPKLVRPRSASAPSGQDRINAELQRYYGKLGVAYPGGR